MLCIVPSFTAIMPAESMVSSAHSSVVVTTVVTCARTRMVHSERRRTSATANLSTTRTRTTRASHTSLFASHPLNT